MRNLWCLFLVFTSLLRVTFCAIECGNVYVSDVSGVDASTTTGNSADPFKSLPYALQTISSVCDVASVNVDVGLYTANGLPAFDSVTIVATHGPEETTLSDVSISDIEGYTFDGFALQNADGRNVAVAFRNCIYKDRTSSVLSFLASRVEFVNCLFQNNAEALRVNSTNLRIDSCHFDANVDSITNFGGIGASFDMTDSVISNNNNAVLLQNVNTTITNCTFSNNNNPNEGTALRIFTLFESSVAQTIPVYALITKSRFLSNAFRSGSGALEGEQNSLSKLEITIVDSEFLDNYGDTGAISVMQYGPYNPVLLLSISNSLFVNNSGITKGGAVHATRSTIPVRLLVSNSTFENNTGNYGGAIHARESTTIISSSTFIGNRANAGGGIYFGVLDWGRKELSLSTCTFKGNNAQRGGDVFAEFGLPNLANVTIDNSEFLGSTASNGGSFQYDVKSFNAVTDKNITIKNTLFANNMVAANGGAIYAVNTLPTYITNCSFANNHGSRGGAIFAENTDLAVMDSTFDNNTCLNAGGGIYFGVDSSTTFDFVISHSLFNNNSASGVTSMGGSVYCNSLRGGTGNYSIVDSNFAGSKAAHGGSLAFVASEALNAKDNATVTIHNCTVENSTSTLDGGAIYALQFVEMLITDSVFAHSYSPQGGAIYSENTNLKLNDTDIVKSSSLYNGGAIYIKALIEGFAYSISNALFKDNLATSGSGGAIAVSTLASIPVLLTNCFVENNSALTFGGGIYATSATQPLIVNSTFYLNVAQQGGAVYSDLQSQPIFQMVNFSENHAISEGGAVTVSGRSQATFDSAIFKANFAANGGAVLLLAQSNASFTECSFSENFATLDRGGAMYTTTSVRSSPQLYECTFEANQAPHGGAIYALYSSAVLEDCIITSNTASLQGGGLFVTSSSSLSLRGATFGGNSALEGGGLYCDENARFILTASDFKNNSATELNGGGIFAEENCFSDISLSTFSENSAVLDGGAMYTQSSAFIIQSNDFKNNMATNGAGFYMENGQQKFSLFGDNSYTGNRATNAGGGFFWHITSVPQQPTKRSVLNSTLAAYVPQCSSCTFDDNYGLYGNDFATKPATVLFLTAITGDLEATGGFIGPFELRVVDYYNQTVTAVVGPNPLRVSVSVSSFSDNAVQPFLSGVTDVSVTDGTASFPALTVFGVSNQTYQLIYRVSGELLGSAPTLITNFTFGGCTSGQEKIISAFYETCRNCSIGFYNTNANGSCLSCPKNAICSGGTVKANDDFWVLSEKGVARTYNCPKGFCKDGGCSEHRSGVLCGTCDPGYQSSGERCLECTENNSGGIFGSIVLLWAYVTVLQLSSKLPNDTVGKEKRYATSGLVNIILFFVQTVYIVSNPTRILWWLFSFFDFYLAMGFGSKCTMKINFFHSFLLAIFIPLILCGLLMVNVVVNSVVHLIVKLISDSHGTAAKYTKVDGNTYIRTVVALVIFSYSHVTQEVFSFINCREVGDTSVVASAPHISCSSRTYERWQNFAYILLTYVILLPIVLLAVLVWANKKHNMQQSFFARKFGILFQCFTNERYYWQVVILLRRMLFIMIYVVAYSEPSARHLALFIFSFIVLVMHLHFRPYYSKIDNDIETSLLILLVVLAGIQSAAANDIFPDEISIFASIVTLLAIIPIGIGLFFYLQDFLFRMGCIPKRIGVSNKRDRLTSIDSTLSPSDATLSPTSTSLKVDFDVDNL